MTTVSSLPAAPSRNSPSDFATKADAWVAAIGTWTTEVNTVAGEVNTNATNAATAASTATTQAGIATTAANTATTKATEATTARNEAVALTESYQGALASDPTLDKNNNPLTAGDWYVNTTTGFIRAYNGTTWVNSVNASAGVTSINGESGTVTGFVKETTSQALTNKTINYSLNNLIGVQPVLVSGTNIKTINGTSVLGSGDLVLNSGALVLLGSATASNSATVDIEWVDSATYRGYVLFFDSVVPVVDEDTLNARLKIGGAYITANYRYAVIPTASDSAGSGAVASQSSGAIPVSRSAFSSNTASEGGLSGEVQVPAPSPLSRKSISFSSSGYASSSRLGALRGEATNDSAGVLTGIRFYFTGGNIASGTFKLYGVAA